MVNRFRLSPSRKYSSLLQSARSGKADAGAESWQQVLKRRCEETDGMEEHDRRESVINTHMTHGKYRLPDLNKATIKSLKIICDRLYKNTTKEVNDSVDLYESLLLAFDPIDPSHE